ncbi:MAG: sigma-54 dependent transcriptional regulator [Candidatus Omnitrophota bacterium]
MVLQFTKLSLRKLSAYLTNNLIKMLKSILVVDDENLIRKSLYELLRRDGYSVDTATNGEEALKKIDHNFDVVISDIKMPKMDGLELLKEIKAAHLHTEVVLITGYGNIEDAVEAMRQGAFDYITKPIVDNEIKIIINKIISRQKLIEENQYLRKRLETTERDKFHGIIGHNINMQKIYALIEAIASTKANVLITGESGTGKRVIAHAIHACDTIRHNKPFVEVSCGALPPTLLESELFGHVKGAFTDASKDRIGRFEAANGGTILLDEIDTFSPYLQVKLLRILQQGEFERVGDTSTVKIDVRIIAATNRDLETDISNNKFREDLYYRINVIKIDIPPLRERLDDLPLLVDHFIKRYSAKMNKKINNISEEALSAMKLYNWPGNIRELENIIERAVILAKEASITINEMPPVISLSDKKKMPYNHQQNTLKKALQEPEKQLILDILEKTNWNRKKAAALLGINRTTLYNKIKKYKIKIKP